MKTSPKTALVAALALGLLTATAVATDTGDPGPVCGDGVLEYPEECDDGAGNDDGAPDACRTNCTLPRCGDGTPDSGEQCDDGAGNADIPDACRTDCSRQACGDGIRDSSETCDDGSANCDAVGCACRTDCSAAGCGNGQPETGEYCDDGNTQSDDGCLASCVFNTCGDGFANHDVRQDLQLIEEPCDPPASGACRYDCGQDLAFCGNGYLEQGETCDEGAANADDPGAACRTDCQAARCGDGVVDPGEECDRTVGCGPDCRVVY